MSGMLIIYGVGHNAAFAAVPPYEAIDLLVPITAGAIAYVLLRPISPTRAQTKRPSPPLAATMGIRRGRVPAARHQSSADRS